MNCERRWDLRLGCVVGFIPAFPAFLSLVSRPILAHRGPYRKFLASQGCRLWQGFVFQSLIVALFIVQRSV